MDAEIYWDRLTSVVAAEVEGSRAAMAWLAENPEASFSDLLVALGPVADAFNPFNDALLRGLREEHRKHNSRRWR